MFFKGSLKNFAIFTEKHVLGSPFKGLQLFKKETPTQVLPVDIAKFLRTDFFSNTSDGCFWQS